MNYEQPLNDLMQRISPEQLAELEYRLNPMPMPSLEEVELHKAFLAKMQSVELPKGADMVIFTEREIHLMQIVMRLLRRHKIFSHTPNMEVFDMVKQEYYNDVHKG